MRQSLAVIDKLARLPPFHPAVLKLLEISIENESAESDYEEAFKSDPALTADLLRMANSAAYGQRTQIQTIGRAVRLLGLEAVRSLATTIALRSKFQRAGSSEYLLTVWAHSIATAVAAEALGGLFGSPGLYTLGLTHDLGRLGLFLSVGEEYATEVSQEFADIGEANEREKARFGLTHCQAGELIAREWGFPDNLSACMANHHNPDTEQPCVRDRLICVACRMAGSLGFQEVPLRQPPPFPKLPDGSLNQSTLEPEAPWDEITRRIATLGL
jgi:HD-like signal output (HDOD) protein